MVIVIGSFYLRNIGKHVSIWQSLKSKICHMLRWLDNICPLYVLLFNLKRLIFRAHQRKNFANFNDFLLYFYLSILFRLLIYTFSDFRKWYLAEKCFPFRIKVRDCLLNMSTQIVSMILTWFNHFTCCNCTGDERIH